MVSSSTWHARNHAFGWISRWTNEDGDPMVTVPAPAFDLLTQVVDAGQRLVTGAQLGVGWAESQDAETELVRAVTALIKATS